jgi:hypothetical protein
MLNPGPKSFTPGSPVELGNRVMSGGKAQRLPPAAIFSYFTGGSKAHERMSATT